MLLDNRPKIVPLPEPKPGDLIEVTRLDVLHGVCEDPEACMVALSLTRKYGGFWEVFDNTAEYYRPGEYPCNMLGVPIGGRSTVYQKFALPVRAEREIHKFDDHERVDPFTFKLGRLLK